MPQTHTPLHSSLEELLLSWCGAAVALFSVFTLLPSDAADAALQAHFLQRSPSLLVASPLPPAPPSVADTGSFAAPSASSASSPSSSPSSASSALSVIAPSSSASPLFSSVSSSSARFPPFLRATHPVQRIPAWGTMRTASEWERRYEEYEANAFISVPRYDLRDLLTPLDAIRADLENEEMQRILTAKLYYSTRHFGAYDLDAGEFSAPHPGIDLKLPEGTPIGSIAGGRVHAVRSEPAGLGTYVIIEHRLEDATYFSVYAHLGSAWVTPGETVRPGDSIGTVGMTGLSTNPHLHLQIDRAVPGAALHEPYTPSGVPGAEEADRYTMHPIRFIEHHR